MGAELKLAFVDIGELGWSMYVNAHIRWHKQQGEVSVAVITYPDRRCLYEGLADVVIDVPKTFYERFDMRIQNCLGLQKILPDTLKRFFVPYLPAGYSIPGDFIIGCKWRYGSRLVFEPYKYSEKLEGRQEILVFPRRRLGGWYSYRNLPESFYSQLIIKLCEEFPSLTVRTIGTAMGAYDINLNKTNYINYIGKNGSLQDMIDRCQTAVATVGSQSGPPKIALLQGVPTYMIGNQRHRHMKGENWMGTNVGFYQVTSDDYSKINVDECIKEIVMFIKSSGRQ